MAPPRTYRDKAAGAEARELVVSPARQRVRLPPKASKAKDNRRAERNTKAKRPRQLHLAHNKKTKTCTAPEYIRGRFAYNRRRATLGHSHLGCGASGHPARRQRATQQARCLSSPQAGSLCPTRALNFSTKPRGLPAAWLFRAAHGVSPVGSAPSLRLQAVRHPDQLLLAEYQSSSAICTAFKAAPLSN